MSNKFKNIFLRINIRIFFIILVICIFSSKVNCQTITLNTQIEQVPPADTLNLISGADNYRFNYTTPDGYYLQIVTYNGNIVRNDSVNGFTVYHVASNQNLRLEYVKISEYSILLKTVLDTQINIVQLGLAQPYRYQYAPINGYYLDSVNLRGVNYSHDSTNGFTFEVQNNLNALKLTYVKGLIILNTQVETLPPLNVINFLPGVNKYRFLYSPPPNYNLDSLKINNVIGNNDSTTGYTVTNFTTNQNLTLFYQFVYPNSFVLRTLSDQYQTPVLELPYNDRYRLTYTPPYSYYLDQLFYNKSLFNKDSIYGSASYYSIKFQTGFTIYNSAGGNQNITLVYQYYNPNSFVLNTITENPILQPLIFYYNGPVRLTYNPPLEYYLTDVKVNNSNPISGSADSVNSFTYRFATTNQTNIILDYQYVTPIVIRYSRITDIASRDTTYQFFYRNHVLPNYTFINNIPAGYAFDSLVYNNVRRTDANINTQFSVSNLNTDATIRLYYHRLYYNIATSANTGGTLTPANNRAYYDSNYTYYFTPNTNYRVDSVFINGSFMPNLNASSSYTFNRIRTNNAIRVVFRRYVFDITTTTNIGGTITPSHNAILDNFDTIHFSANIGYVIDSLLVNDVKTNFGNGYLRLGPIRASQTISLFTSRQKFTFNIAKINTNLNTTNTFDTTIYYDSFFSVNFTPPLGYVYDSIIVNGTQLNNWSETINYDSVRQSYDIKAYFSLKKFQITTNVNIPQGSITPSFITNYGTSINITYTATTGYTIDSVKVNNQILSNFGNTYTNNNVTENISIEVFASRTKFNLITSVNIPAGGTISPSTTIFYDNLFVVSYNANRGYTMDSVMIINGLDTITLYSGNSIPFFSVRNNIIVNLFVTPIPVNINARANVNDRGTVNSGSSFYGQSFTLNIQANNGYFIDTLKIGSAFYVIPFHRTRLNYTINNIVADSQVIVIFDSVGVVDRDHDGLIDIYAIEQLNNIRYDVSGARYKESVIDEGDNLGCPDGGCFGYELTNNLNFLDTNSYLSGEIDTNYIRNQGWKPIDDSVGYSLFLNGNNFTISNLYINATKDSVGLFVYLDSARILNLNFSNVFVRGVNKVGVLAGVINNSTIQNINVLNNNDTNTIASISGQAQIGGLTGVLKDSSIVNSIHILSTLSGTNRIGGIAGSVQNNALINNSYSRVFIDGGNTIGGIAGVVLDSSFIFTSYSQAYLKGDSILGGLTGCLINKSSIGNSFFIGDYRPEFNIVQNISSTMPSLLGGLAGVVNNQSTISNSYGRSININGNNQIGGLVGILDQSSGIVNTYVTESKVQGISKVGGIVGVAQNSSQINNSYSTAIVKASSNVGGIAGVNLSASAINVYWDTVTSLQNTDALSTTQGLSSQTLKDSSGLVKNLGNQFVYNSIPGSFYPKLLSTEDGSLINAQDTLVGQNAGNYSNIFIIWNNQDQNFEAFNNLASIDSFIILLDTLPKLMTYLDTVSGENSSYVYQISNFKPETYYYKIYNTGSQIYTDIISYTYNPPLYNIITSATPGSTIDPSSTAYLYNNVDVNFNVDPAYNLDSLVVNGHVMLLPNSPYNINSIYSNQSISLYTSRSQYSILTQQNVPNSVIISPSVSTILFDSMYQVTFTLNAGYKLDSVIVDDNKVMAFNSYTFSNIRENHYITVFASLSNQSITTSSNSIAGSITPSFTPLYGDTVDIDYAANYNATIDSILVNGVKQNQIQNDTGTITLIANQNYSIQLFSHFNVTQITTIEATIGANISSSKQSLTYFDTANIVFNPSVGYILDSVVLNNVKLPIRLDTLFSPFSYALYNRFGNDTFKVYASRQIFNVFKTYHNSSLSTIISANYKVYYDSSITLEFPRGSGDFIDSIYINYVKEKPPYQYPHVFDTIKSSKSIDIFYSVRQFNVITHTNNNGGSILGPSQPVNYFSDISVYFRALPGYKVDSLVINGKDTILNDTVNFYNLLVDKDYDITLYTSKLGYQLYKNSSSGAQITSNKTRFATGDQDSLFLNASRGYKLDSLVIYDSSSNSAITILNPGSNYVIDSLPAGNVLVSLYASLQLNQVSVNLNNLAGAQYTLENDSIGLDSFAVVNLQLTQGYFINAVYVNNILIPTPTNSTILVKNTDGTDLNIYIDLERELNEIIITNRDPNLGFTPDNLYAYYGSTSLVSVVAQIGYVIDSIVVNGRLIKIPSQSPFYTYTFNNVRGDSTINISFKRKGLYTISTTINYGGSITSTTLVDTGNNFTVTYMPYSGFKVDSVFVDNIYVKDSFKSYTFYSLNNDHTIVVTFKSLYYSLSVNNFNLNITNLICANANNGALNISVKDTLLTYIYKLASRSKNDTSSANTQTYSGLSAGVDSIEIWTTDTTVNHVKFAFTITQPQPISAYSYVQTNDKLLQLNLAGGTLYTIHLNNKTWQTTESINTIQLNSGINIIHVTDEKSCLGSYSDTILIIDNVVLYPNPAQNSVHINLGDFSVLDVLVTIEILNERGVLVKRQQFNTQDHVNLDISNLPNGIYFAKIIGEKGRTILKFLKQ